jgi:ElaB/YqjD/DUF883 family membrane-anchored ribosome-binding protein
MEQDKENAAPKPVPEPAPEQDAHPTRDAVKEKIGHAKDYVGERYQAVSEKVKNRYETVSQAAKEKASEVKSRVEQVEMDDVLDQMRDYVRSNPGKALLISIGVGFVIGLIMRGTDDEED